MANGWILRAGSGGGGQRMLHVGGMSPVVVAYELWPCQPDCSPQMLDIG